MMSALINKTKNTKYLDIEEIIVVNHVLKMYLIQIISLSITYNSKLTIVIGIVYVQLYVSDKYCLRNTTFLN